PKTQLPANTPVQATEPAMAQASPQTSTSPPPTTPPTSMRPTAPDGKTERSSGAKGSATVTVAAARLRDQPSANSEVVHKATEGDVFEVVDEWTQPNGNKWYKVRLPDGRDGWIASYIVHLDMLR
ncbi:MAG TPA: hypothetical protein DCE18_12550, partial [Syntrophobacteraceae bacterium]|nr:hypothetical protein [Syntrophobacteraceae bacterium]